MKTLYLKNILAGIFDVVKEISIQKIFVLLLSSIFLVMTLANFFRYISKGVNNVRVYESESKILEEAKRKNQELSEELKFYKTKDAKLILARDTLSLTYENEKLFKTEDDKQFFLIEKELLDLGNKKLYFNLWQFLL